MKVGKLSPSFITLLSAVTVSVAGIDHQGAGDEAERVVRRRQRALTDVDGVGADRTSLRSQSALRRRAGGGVALVVSADEAGHAVGQNRRTVAAISDGCAVGRDQQCSLRRGGVFRDLGAAE